MDDAFLRTEPTKLRIVGEMTPETGEVRRDVREPPAEDDMTKRLDRRHDHFVAAADRERQTMTLEI